MVYWAMFFENRQPAQREKKKNFFLRTIQEGEEGWGYFNKLGVGSKLEETSFHIQ
jgi:hypothetical protein